MYEESSWLVKHKQIDHLDEHCRAYLAVCGFVVLASADAQGRADVTPRGGPRGLRRACSTTGRSPSPTPPATAASTRCATSCRPGSSGMLALLPGRGQTLRVNGRACVSTDPRAARLAHRRRQAAARRARDGGRGGVHALPQGVRALRAVGPRRPGRRKDEQPSPAAMLRDHVGDPALTLADAEQAMIDAVTIRLATWPIMLAAHLSARDVRSRPAT